MQPLDAQRVRQMFTNLGYDVTNYSDAEVWGAIRRALTDTRSAFATSDVRAAFETLSTGRKLNE